MTKHKEKEEDIIAEKDVEKEVAEEVAEVEHAKQDFELAEKLKEVEAKAEEYLNNWKRAVADFENYKKRQAQSQQQFFQFANEGLILQIIPILDNFQMSTEHVPEDQKTSPWVTGIMHIQKQLDAVLKDNGVAEIEAKVGDKFDPAFHEAVKGDSNDTNEHPNDANKIKKIIQKGYKIGGRVIRPARVIVE